MILSEVITKLKLGKTVFMTHFNAGVFMSSLGSETYNFVIVRTPDEVGFQLIEINNSNKVDPNMN